MKKINLLICLAVNVLVTVLFVVFAPLWVATAYAVLNIISLVHAWYVFHRLGLLA